MILKSFMVEKDVALLEQYQHVLIYGENDGIKEDIKQKIREKNKDSEIINLFQEQIVQNKNIILEEIKNASLFSAKKIIFLHEITDKFFSQITESLEIKNEDLKIYIFSQILEKKSKLRSYFEKEKKFGIIPCYQDNERTLINHINLKLKDYKGLSPQIVSLIISNSSLDRKIINSEILSK